MRYALLDNSTLTSVQRLLGEIPVKNLAIIETDIAAFENLIQSILFFDNIVCIDDYKEEYKQSRKSYFSNIKFLPTKVFPYKEINVEAQRITDNIKVKIEGGKVTDSDFKELFAQLNMNITFTWDISSSVFFLTQKMLIDQYHKDLEKFSILLTALNREFYENELTNFSFNDNKPILYDSRGKKITSKYTLSNQMGSGKKTELSESLIHLISSLNWLAQRTSFYTLVGDYVGADVFLHPTRQQFLSRILARTYYNSTNKLKTALDEMTFSSIRGITAIKSIEEPFLLSYKIPLFATYLIHKTKNPKKIIEEAYELRNKKSFFEARTKLREINQLLISGEHNKYLRELNKLKSDLDALIEKIKIKYSVDGTRGISLSTFTSIWNFSTYFSGAMKLPKINTKIESLEFLKHLKPQKAFKGVFKNVVEELTSIEKLGRYFDLMTSAVDVSPEPYKFRAKTEDEKYKNYTSWFKIPM